MTWVANVTVGTSLLINWRVWRVACHIPLLWRRGMLVTRQHCASAACIILWQSKQKHFLCYVKIMKLKSWPEFWLYSVKYTRFWSLKKKKKQEAGREARGDYSLHSGKKNIRILSSKKKYFENTVFYKFCYHERDTRIHLLLIICFVGCVLLFHDSPFSYKICYYAHFLHLKDYGECINMIVFLDLWIKFAFLNNTVVSTQDTKNSYLESLYLFLTFIYCLYSVAMSDNIKSL